LMIGSHFNLDGILIESWCLLKFAKYQWEVLSGGNHLILMISMMLGHLNFSISHLSRKTGIRRSKNHLTLKPGGEFQFRVGELDPDSEGSAGGINDLIDNNHFGGITAADRFIQHNLNRGPLLDGTKEIDREKPGTLPIF
jgi:hypothetical protein